MNEKVKLALLLLILAASVSLAWYISHAATATLIP